MENRDQFVKLRMTAQERQSAQDTARNGGWKSLSDMVRVMVARAQSEQPQPQTAPPRPDRPAE